MVSRERWMSAPLEVNPNEKASAADDFVFGAAEKMDKREVGRGDLQL